LAAGWLTPALEATMTREPEQRWPIAMAQEFLEAGPRATTTPVAPGPARSFGDGDTGTQVLPLRPPPPTPLQTPADLPDGGPQGRRWLVVVAAALAVVVAMGAAFALGLSDRADDDADGSSPGPSTGTSESAPPDDVERPTEEGMTAFIEDYIATAVRDPAAGFEMLTPAFQEQSDGIEGYESFWGEVRSARILSSRADPDALEVTYRYRYERPPDGPEEDEVTLRLTFDEGTYLIDDEL
jgi:hypothetical protein